MKNKNISKNYLIAYIYLSQEYEDIYSIEYKGICFINQNYNSRKYGNIFFVISV